MFTSVCSLSVLFLLFLSILTEYIKGFREVIEKFTIKSGVWPNRAGRVLPEKGDNDLSMLDCLGRGSLSGIHSSCSTGK